MKKICILLTIAGLLFSACSRGPEAIQYGKDACWHCKMTIMDKRFAAEIVTAKGKVYKFDSAECMAGYLKENPGLATDKQALLFVSYYQAPGSFNDARKSVFLEAPTVSSPMGGNLAAFGSENLAKRFQNGAAGTIYNWNELLKSRP